ncbi:peroxisomal and mitochondrial division factor 1-like isoform X2 [Actinia tenebrosa]|uniref:Peroxisomal and mitochondrial division factor 1-like isoform X2 n=1 Tax=Actinia tenebrosa TaxID=6105 RepID=A0A6P8ITH1_ACTTE|nr:peroxisomal and mitochondrial division factor 1-like isoform X2 [Actinia tenebrosa]
MDPNHDQNNIEDEIRRNKERIASLERDLKESLRSNEDLKDRINALKEEIQNLKDKNELLNKQLQEMKDDNESIKKRMEILEKENDYHKAMLIIVQIGTAIQRNLCKYVLGECFKEQNFYKFKDIDKYVQQDLRHDRKAQESARNRLAEIREKIPWDQRLVDSLKNLKQARNGIAHPDLSSENIQQATDYLKKENILDEGMVHNVNELKRLWKTTEELLKAAGGSEDGPEGGTMDLSTTEQSQDTYVSRSTGGPEDDPEGGTMDLSTAGRQNQDTFARGATGGHYLHTKA